MIITEAQENRWIETVKNFMHMFQRLGDGRWYHETKTNVYAFKWDKQSKTLLVICQNKKDKSTSTKKYYNDIMGLTEFMKGLTDSSGSLVENASCGATCAGCVASVPSQIGSPIKRNNKKKKKEPRLDVELFKECISNGEESCCRINGKMCKYIITEGSGFLYIGKSIAKTLSKKVMVETVDALYNDDKVSVDLLENYSAREMITLLNEDLISPKGVGEDMNNDSPSDNEPMNAEEQEIVNNLDQEKDSTDFSIVDNKENKVLDNQEYVGFDKTNKVATMKDKNTGDIRNVTLADIIKEKE